MNSAFQEMLGRDWDARLLDLLGWRFTADDPPGYECPDGHHRWAIAPDGLVRCMSCQYDELPALDLATAFEIVGEMEARWWWFALETFPSPYGMNDGQEVVATFKPTGMPGQPLDDVTAAASTVTDAICRAALEALSPISAVEEPAP